MFLPRQLFIVFCLGAFFGSVSSPALADPTKTLRDALQEADQAVATDESEIAESRYRTALQEGWLLLGALAHEEGRIADARLAFQRAAAAATATRRARLSLALVELQDGNAQRSVSLLRALLRENLADGTVRRILPRALMAADLVDEAVQEMEELHAVAPEVLDNTYALARAALGQGDEERAQVLFAELAQRRPAPETHVLIGRTYRDYGRWELAHQALERAIEMDPEVVRAHYYLASVDLFAHGLDRLDEALEHLEAELEVSPRDAMSNLYLGAALVERRRFAEALEPLRVATQRLGQRVDPWQFLGRAHLGLGQTEEAIEVLRRAIDLANAAAEQPTAADTEDRRQRQLSSLHYQLGRALRASDRAEEAAEHFALAKDSSAESAEGSRQLLEIYLSDEQNEELLASSTWPLDLLPFSGIGAADRARAAAVARRAVVQANFNLGVQQTQERDFASAAAHYAEAARLDPDFPRVHFALGTARFNSGDFAGAVEPLERAFGDGAGDATTRRLLALAKFNSEDFAGAAELLAEDPGRQENPSLEYTYAAALVRSGQAERAEPLFARLLQVNADWPDLNVLLGQAHAQEQEYDAAIPYLQRAIAVDPAVAGARATLGDIHLRRGELDAAEEALRGELEHHPLDTRTRYNLAVVLDLNRKPEAAREVLDTLLREAPDHASGRYLSGKLLLAQGAVSEAIAQLEAAAKLSPEDPKIRNQLGRAYQRAGRTAAAQEQFDAFQRLKSGDEASDSPTGSPGPPGGDALRPEGRP